MSQQRGPNGIMLFNSVGGCSLVLDLFIGCAGSSFLCADRNEVFFLVADKPRLHLVAMHRLLIFSLRWLLLLQSTGSMHTGFSSCGACGAWIFPDQGLNLCPPHWQVDSYALYHQGSPSGCSGSQIVQDNFCFVFILFSFTSKLLIKWFPWAEYHSCAGVADERQSFLGQSG